MDKNDDYKTNNKEFFRDVKICQQCKWFSFTEGSEKRFKWYNPTSLYHVCIQDSRDHCPMLMWFDSSKISNLKEQCRDYDLMPFEIRELPKKCPYKTEHMVYDCNISRGKKILMNIALVVKMILTCWII